MNEFANADLCSGQTRFGCVYVDYKNDCKRYPKQSAKVLKDIFKKYIQ